MPVDHESCSFCGDSAICAGCRLPALDHWSWLVYASVMHLRNCGVTSRFLALSCVLFACSEGTQAPLTGAVDLGASGGASTSMVSGSSVSPDATTPASTTDVEPVATSPDSSMPTPVSRHGQLQVVGSQLHDANDAAVILRGQGF